MDNNDTQRMSEAEQTALIREHLETSKQRAIVYRDWGYFGITVLVGTMLIMALWSWRQANLVAGATQARLNGILDKLDTKIDSVQTERLNELLTAGRGTVEGLQPVEHELAAFIADNRRNTNNLTGAAVSRINQLGENLSSLKAVTDRSAEAVAGITKATTTLEEKFGLTADEAVKAIAMASEKTGKSLDALAVQIADPRWGKAADNLVATTDATHTLVVDTTRHLNDIGDDAHNTLKQMPDIAKDIQGTTREIKRFARVSIVVSIISRLASSLIPGLLN